MVRSFAARMSESDARLTLNLRHKGGQDKSQIPGCWLLGAAGSFATAETCCPDVSAAVSGRTGRPIVLLIPWPTASGELTGNATPE